VLLAQREKVEKESRRFFGRKLSYLQLSDKYGLTGVVARKRAGLPPLAIGPAGREELGRPVELAPAEAVPLDQLADLPMDLITEQLDLCKVTKLPQRLAQLESQPEAIGSIFPRHKHLMIKRSQRCRRCEHNLSKPEYNPTSIKFKIQLAAYYHVPDIVIYKVEPLVVGAKAQFVIKVVNPTNTGTELELVSLKAHQAAVDSEEAERAEARARGEEREDRPVSAINPLRQPSLVAAEDGSLGLVTAEALLPAGVKIYLPPRDDAAEFDDGGVDLAGHTDDKEVVQWRKSNKAGLRLGVVPSEVGPVVVGFGIQYQYTNTVFALGKISLQCYNAILLHLYNATIQ
jgi:dynactin-4